MTKKQKTTIFIIILSTIILVSIGIGVYFVIQNQKKNQNNQNNNINTNINVNNDYFVGNPLNLIGDKTGFITNNWGLISDNNFLNNDNLKIDLNKAMTDINKDKFYLSFNSLSDHSMVGFDISSMSGTDSYRIAHWNSLNFSLLSDKDYLLFNDWKNNTNFKYTTTLLHAYFIAKLINFMNVDIIGLTEINKDVPQKNLDNFLDMLNYISGNKYKAILSNNLSGKTSSPAQIEEVAIIYNYNKFNLMQADVNQLVYENKLYDFDSMTKSWSLATNQNPNAIDKKINFDYVRPPFAGVFSSKTDDLKISCIFSHNDSPGASKTESSFQGMGSKEFFEANQIQNVLTYFKTKFPGFAPIYMGDTNIKLNKQNIAFSTIDKNTYDFAFLDNAFYNSSLTTTKTAKTELEQFNNTIKSLKNDIELSSQSNQDKITGIYQKLYANPYDKIIYDKQVIKVNKFSNANLIATFNTSSINEGFINLIKNIYFVVNNNPIIIEKRKL